MKNENKKPENPVLNRGAFGGTTNYTLRDYFAAKAMQAMVSRESPSDGWNNGASSQAYYIADSMLKEREK